MNETTDWIYIASRRTQEVNPQMTVPPPVFDVVPILSRDRDVFLSVDTDTGYLVISNLDPDYLVISDRHADTSDEYAHTENASLRVSGTSRAFKAPEDFRVNEESSVPDTARLGAGMLRFFITTPERSTGRFRSCFVVSATQLLDLVESPAQWEQSSANRRRLSDLLQYDQLEHLYPTGELPAQAGESYEYVPSKAGTIEVTVDTTTLRARWFKPETKMNASKSTSWFVIETECEIIDLDEQVVTPVGETEQYIAKYNEYGQFAVQSQEGRLDHVPKAIRRAIQHGDWHLQEPLNRSQAE